MCISNKYLLSFKVTILKMLFFNNYLHNKVILIGIFNISLKYKVYETLRQQNPGRHS